MDKKSIENVKNSQCNNCKENRKHKRFVYINSTLGIREEFCSKECKLMFIFELQKVLKVY